MTIAEALQIKPQIAGILFAKGMHCIGCSIAASETIAQAANVHGLDADELIKEVNQN
jgi:hybrid cluster-associated redox disulfide protein